MSDSLDGRPYILGLDLGVSSIGWALLDDAKSTQPVRIIRAGVHLFEAGVDGGKQGVEDAMSAGKEKSKATPRRDARQQRRQTWRRTYRKRLVLKRLIRHGLLPQPPIRLATPEDIDSYLKSIDEALRAKWETDAAADHRTRQLLPYRLRAEAVHRRVEAHEVGRALYHLAQRRGFLSNRKTDADDADNDDDKSTGKVKAGISELEQLMAGRTLGEFFASLDPTDPESRRVRGRWTGRSMYEDEFTRIWAEQAKHHRSMTEQARTEIHGAIFRQRPLKSQRHLIGRCSLLPRKRRALIADRLSQRFRMIQKINDLMVIPCVQVEVEDFDKKTGEVKINAKTGLPRIVKRWVPDPRGVKRPLSAEERAAAIARLSKGDATFEQLRKAGAAPKESRFNFETDGEQKLPGLRTDEKLREVFGERWDQLTEDERDSVVEDCVSMERADAMEKRGRQHWNLSAESARAFARVKLEEGYANLSRAAMRRLLPAMERGVPFMTARKAEFPESFEAIEPVDLLPPLVDAFKGERLSPAVARALSEARGVLNAIVRRYGKPTHIRIELARELKKGRSRREMISKQIADRRRERDSAAERLLKQYPGRQVREDDKIKVLLADECGWQCPYTGRSFGWNDLFGAHPTIDVEHIWPFKRSLDDSFINKTLCCVHENRTVKRNQMPSEAYDPARLNEILQRVARFKGDAAREKLERFRAESIPPDFANRHLAESRYISRKAAEYVSLLYGGYSDEDSTRRVHVTSGGLTFWLRREWGLDAILSDRNEKERTDHRHHAVDAIVIALTTPATVKALEEAAERADNAGSNRLFLRIDPPFDMEDAKRAIDAIVVSHRQRRAARGGFHKDTVYSRPLPKDASTTGHRIRKELHKLNENEMERIVDPRIRDVVKHAYEARKAAGAKTPAQAFSDPAHRPLTKRKDGTDGDRIRKVRLFSSAMPVVVGTSAHDRKQRGKAKERRVDLQANHHTVIMAKLNPDGTEKTWVDQPVSLFDAMQRVREGKPLISREVPEGYVFKFSLAANDYIEMKNAADDRVIIYRVLSVSKGDIAVVVHIDGRTMKERQAAKERERVRGSSLFDRKARKVHVNYLGEVKNAGG